MDLSINLSQLMRIHRLINSSIYPCTQDSSITRYSSSDITKVLRINTGQIKDNLRIETKMNFVEVMAVPSSTLPEYSITPSFDHKQMCSIELSRANGVALKISLLPIESLQKIISQFME